MADQADSTEETIFTKIINGSVPSHKVYEDERTYAFMDIYPVKPGMVVVVSKTAVANFEDLTTEDAAALWATVQKVARTLRAAFPAKKKIAVQVEGLEVQHTHVKLFPIDSSEDFHSRQDTTIEPDHAALAAMAQKLQLSLHPPDSVSRPGNFAQN